MIEYQIVETAVMFPQTCFCGSSKGPLIDTNVMRGQERIYLCKLCVKRSARPFGFMPGKRMDELENASLELEQKDKELAEAHRRNEKQTAANADLSRRLDEQATLLEHYRGLNEQYKHLAGIVAENARELVSTANGGV